MMLSDSQSILRKIESFLLRTERIALLSESRIKYITCIYCHDHRRARDNERADSLAGKAVIDGTVLTRCRADLIRAVMDIAE